MSVLVTAAAVSRDVWWEMGSHKSCLKACKRVQKISSTKKNTLHE